MRSNKYIIGQGNDLELAISDWSALDSDDFLIPVELKIDDYYSFDLTIVHKLNPEMATAFIVWSSNFMNFQRLEIFMELKKLGFKLPPLICRNANIAKDSLISENVYVSTGVTIDSKVFVGMNTRLLRGANIASNVRVGSSCFIDAGATLEDFVIVGDHSTIGRNSFISESVSIGKNCFLGAHMIISEHVRENTYLSEVTQAVIY